MKKLITWHGIGSNFMKKKFIIVLSLFALITGCATPALDEGFTMTGHKTFEVLPVVNETGKTFDNDIAAELTKHIISELMEREFGVTDTLEDAIIIKTSVISYEIGSTGAHCTVKSKLIDKKTQKVLVEIVTAKTLHVGGLESTGLAIDEAILNTVADDIASEVESRIRRNGSFFSKSF